MTDKFVSKIVTPFGERLIKASAVTDDVKNALKNIFIAEIGVTSYNDVLSAYNNDKTIIGKISENTTYGVKTSYYPLLEYVTDSDEGDYFFFGLATNGNIFTYWNLHILGGWGSKTTSTIVEIDDSLNVSSTNPVQNAAVYAAINGVKTIEFINFDTTFAQVGTILTDGKLPILVEETTPNSPNYYSLINNNGGTEYIFENISGTLNRTYKLSGGGWTSNADISFENSSNKVTSWSVTPSDTKYPSEKLVYDTIGDVETLLAAL
jgi:hypothetical protein